MAFKKLEDVKKQMYGHTFRLEDDKDFAKVVPLYGSYSDVVIIDCHYINTPEYKGYVHCLEDGCPACQKGVALKHKIFVPLLILSDLNDSNQYPEDVVVFWDRNSSFDYQLKRDFFNKYPNPSNVVFQIVRNGVHRDINTTYSINPVLRFGDDLEARLQSLGVQFPDYYDVICKQYSAIELSDLLASSNSSPSTENLPTATLNYEVKPRTVVDPSTLVDDLPMSSDDLPVLNLQDVMNTQNVLNIEEVVDSSDSVNEEVIPFENSTVVEDSDDDTIDSEPNF